jgi:hypothetical protein
MDKLKKMIEELYKAKQRYKALVKGSPIKEWNEAGYNVERARQKLRDFVLDSMKKK